MIPDIKTLTLLNFIIGAVGAGVVAVIWSQNRGRFAGISLWLVGIVLWAAGLFLMMLRGLMPDLITIPLANTILQAGVLILFIGLERFTGKKGWQIHNYVLLAVFMAVMTYFGIVQPNLREREIAVSAITMILTFQCSWLLLCRVEPGMRRVTRLTGIVFAVYAAFSFARLVLTIISPEQSNDFFIPGAVNALALTGYIVISICLVSSLILMVSRRLLADVNSQEDKFTTAFKSSPYAITLTRPSDGRIFEVNEGFVDISGYQYSEIIGMTTLDLNLWVNEKDRLAVVSELAQGRDLHAVEYQFRHKTGRVISGLFSATVITVNNETCIMSSIADITERKRGEEALRENEERHRTILQTAMDGFWMTDVRGRLIQVNESYCRMSGYSAQELLAMHVSDIEMADDITVRMQKVMAQGTSRFESRHRRKDGSVFDVEISIQYRTDEEGSYVGFLRDITDRKRMEEEQQRTAKLESVGVLAGGIAHDFNNILTSILGNISLARIEAAPGSGIRESLEQAEKASLRAKHLNQQLLTFSKGGAPVTKLASLTELLRDTAGFALRGSNVNCHFSIPTDLWHAEIDEGQVSQIIHNLVINAQQSMPAGGTIELTAENIALSEKQSIGKGLPLKEGVYIRIAVSDHGSGIPAEQLDRIFDPFFTTKQTGSGLGLATSFSIARRHGGHISVESEPGKGSTFYLYLPASMQKAVPQQAREEANKPVEKARILVMDDEQGIREVAGRLLKHIGYQDIEFAADGAKAIKLYKAAMKSGNPFNAVILDLTIPGGMGGRETIEKLLKIDPGVRAIMSSGYANQSAMAEYRGYGFSGMAAKPYSIEELAKALRDVIGGT